MSDGKKNYLRQAWLVIVLSLAFGGVLAAVQVGLGPKIAANKLNETMGQVPTLVKGAVRGEETKLGGQTVYKALDKDGKLVGWVVPASGQGFADVIEVLIGLDATGQTITGLYVLSQKETPGLGNYIEGAWNQQYNGQSTLAPLSVTKGAAGPGQIQALTGATISSDAVTTIVNDAVAKLKPQLAAAAKE